MQLHRCPDLTVLGLRRSADTRPLAWSLMALVRLETLTQSEHPEASPAGQGELQLPLCYPFWIGPLPPLDLHVLKC
jgi:hypothetical protein